MKGTSADMAAGGAAEGPDAEIVALARAVVALEAADQALATAWADDAEAAPPREVQQLQHQMVRAARRLRGRLARQRPQTAVGVRAMAAAAIAAPGAGGETLARSVCRVVASGGTRP
ncbi:hypothetical protein [Roseicella frigidaeris]|uniref:hypothetical protein n=1 Tax=Roseicella frigidaeris TaxID=2230885 RepID=UPI000FDDBD6E|nr:hypothetical protein [Roseicella frigidaeris]